MKTLFAAARQKAPNSALFLPKTTWSLIPHKPYAACLYALFAERKTGRDDNMVAGPGKTVFHRDFNRNILNLVKAFETLFVHKALGSPDNSQTVGNLRFGRNRQYRQIRTLARGQKRRQSRRRIGYDTGDLLQNRRNVAGRKSNRICFARTAVVQTRIFHQLKNNGIGLNLRNDRIHHLTASPDMRRPPLLPRA